MPSIFENMKVKELNNECRRLGIKLGGKKNEIIERLEAVMANGKNNNCKSMKRKSIPTASTLKRQKVDEDAILHEIDSVFDIYEDKENPGEITDEGLMRFFSDLAVDAQDPVVLVLSWYMEAETMCTYTREEFRKGFQKLKCQNIDDLKGRTSFLRRNLEDPTSFTKIYSFVYQFSKERGQKSLSLEMALELWKLLLSTEKFPLLNEYLKFVQSSTNKVISKDIWMQTLEFSRTINADLSNYDEDGAWPVLLDDFVAHMKKKI